MGSIISLELISNNFFITINENKINYSFLMFIVILACVFTCISTLIILKIKKLLRPKVRNHWTQPPTLMAIILLILICSPIIEAGKYKIRSRSHNLRKAAKFTGKTSASILASSAAFIGLDHLASYLMENPDISALLLTAICLFVITILLLFTHFIIKLYKKLKTTNQLNENNNKQSSPLSNIELQNLRQIAAQLSPTH